MPASGGEQAWLSRLLTQAQEGRVGKGQQVGVMGKPHQCHCPGQGQEGRTGRDSPVGRDRQEFTCE